MNMVKMVFLSNYRWVYLVLVFRVEYFGVDFNYFVFCIFGFGILEVIYLVIFFDFVVWDCRLCDV